MVKACIFDLDGVIVDTAKYHFLAWQRLANKLGIDFTEEENEHLKGVSRVQSLEYILRLGKVELSNEDKLSFAHLKNEWYVDLISNLSSDEILPGVMDLLNDLKSNNVKIALGSASKNAVPILKSIGILPYFDYISDGNSTDKSKPDPEVFIIAAEGINETPAACIVFEDSIKGIEAANIGHFRSLGIGDKNTLHMAEYTFENLIGITWSKLQTLYN
jgi:beta-phosphoglucomutase